MFVPLCLLLIVRSSCAAVLPASDLATGVLNNAKGNLVTPVRSVDSIFLKYPTSVELDEIILSADSLSVLKLIQNIVNDKTLSCTQIMAYLLEVDGRIKNAIVLKSFSRDQLDVILYAAERQISRLKVEVNRFEGEQTLLFLDNKKSNLKRIVSNLDAAYNRYNSAVERLQPLQQQLINKRELIANYTAQSDNLRSANLNNQLFAAEADSEIKQLQSKLAIALQKKKNALQGINANNQSLLDKEIKIRNLRNDIANLDRQIKNQKNQVDSLKKSYSDVEVEAERLRSEIASAETQFKTLAGQINGLKGQIAEQEKRLVYSDQKLLKDMISNLIALQPGVEFEINRQYYYCYGEGSVQVEKTGSVTIYIIQGEVINSYLQKAYNIPDALFYFKGNITLQPVDIFANTWTSNFGNLYQNTTLESAKQIGKMSKFWCLNPSALTSGYGKVSSIDSEQITLTSSLGSKIVLNLSSCTRMELVAGRSMPKAGQSILWRGVPVQTFEYNLYTCTFV